MRCRATVVHPRHRLARLAHPDDCEHGLSDARNEQNPTTPAQADAPARVADLKKLRSNYEQRDFIEKGGWAVAIVSDAPDYQLASECAKSILAAKPA